jgi:hypothetical protein
MTEKTRVGPLVSITGLERYGERGWTWTQVYQDLLGDRIAQICRTNGSGAGLWYWRKSPTCWNADGTPYREWKQTLGTCQFSLTRSSRRKAYQEIRQYVIKNHLEVEYA